MKTTALASVLAAVALGGVGLLYLKVERLSDDVESLSRAPLEQSRGPVAAGDDGSGWLPPRRGGSAGWEGPEKSETGPSGPAPSGEARGRGRGTLEERLARLERKVRKEAVARSPAKARPYRLYGGRRRMYARSMDDLARTLHLTSTQRVRVQSAVERGRERIEAVLKIPDETGKSPYERRQEQRKKLDEAVRAGKAGTIFSFAGNLLAEKTKKIPGRNESYGQAIDRIKKETREEIGGALSTDQEKSFQDTNIDPLIGAQGSTGAVSFVFTDIGGKSAEKKAPGGD